MIAYTLQKMVLATACRCNCRTCLVPRITAHASQAQADQLTNVCSVITVLIHQTQAERRSSRGQRALPGMKHADAANQAAS